MENCLHSSISDTTESTEHKTPGNLSSNTNTEIAKSPFYPNTGSPYCEPSPSMMSPSSYQKMPQPKETYLAYVVAIRDPLNLHLDIYWPSEMEKRYSSAIHYDYTFVSEELSEEIYVRTAFSCHLRGIEVISNEPHDFSNMKESYIEVSKRLLRSNGWVLVSVSDIDIYRRVLVNIFDVINRKSINNKLLQKISKRTGEHIVKEYSRPLRTRTMFQPNSETVPKDYHIIFSSKT